MEAGEKWKSGAVARPEPTVPGRVQRIVENGRRGRAAVGSDIGLRRCVRDGARKQEDGYEDWQAPR
jgi:hypothetical protein